MRLSVIICTKNRRDSLLRAIEALGKCKFHKPWEILVVDNGSSDGTSDAARRALSELTVPSRVIYEEKRGNGHGRNAAIAIASGEIAFFTDDDCLVDANALEALDREFEDEQLGFVAGRIDLFNPLDYLCCYFYRSTPLYFRRPWFLRPGFVQGSNMAFRLEPIRGGVGLFDPVFGAGARFAGEDLELAMRFILSGWNGKYSPDVRVRHNHGRSAEDYKKLEYFYDEGVGAYIEKTLSNSRCSVATRASIAFFMMRLAIRSKPTFQRVAAGRKSYLEAVAQQ